MKNETKNDTTCHSIVQRITRINELSNGKIRKNLVCSSRFSDLISLRRLQAYYKHYKHYTTKEVVAK